MFDDIGPNHRQGTAIFSDSFIASPPAGDPAPDAWVARMRFWTTAHEMGHAFNLAHSWQKAHPPTWGTPWIPMHNEPEARSFMNYPYNVAGGQTAFFGDFRYRFSDQELLFMRHAPAMFVQMGNADWFDHHGFRQMITSPEPPFRLTLRSNRERNVYEFMEAPGLELKLTNVTSQPRLIEDGLLRSRERLTVIIKKEGKPARQYVDYTQLCLEPKQVVVAPGQSVYEALTPASGLNGWDLAEPGRYTLQVALDLEEAGSIVSNPLRLRIAAPQTFEEERLAQDFFSDEVGRILAMNGSQVLDDGNDTLKEVVERGGDRPAALRARMALAAPLAKDYKVLSVPEPAGAEIGSVGALGGSIVTKPPETKAAQALLQPAMDAMGALADTFGHVALNHIVEQVSDTLAAAGAQKEAVGLLDKLHGTLKARNVLDWVLDDIKAREARLQEKK
jgi:hypothetical protein